MIALDYNLNIKKEHKTFIPVPELINPIINSNNRIFEISCKSGSGKTFLLNLIAYALKAYKLSDDYILPSLKDSILRYNNSEYYSLTYDIKLQLPDGRHLILQKDSEERIIQYENQPPINYHSLHKRVTVLYDIPANPRERLNGVIKDLGIWNDNIIDKIRIHTNFLNELRKEFNNERDDDKIAEFKNEFKKFDEKLKADTTRLHKTEKTLVNLKTLQNLLDIQSISKEEDILTLKTQELSKELKKLNKPSSSKRRDLNKLRKLEREFISLNKDYNAKILKLNDCILSKSDISKHIHSNPTLKESYSLINKEIDFYILFNKPTSLELYSKIIKSLDFFKTSIGNYIREEKSGNKYKLNQGLNNLMNIIHEFNEADLSEVIKRITTIDIKTLENKINDVLEENIIVNYSEISFFLRKPYIDMENSLKKARLVFKKIEEENNKKEIDQSEIKFNKLKANLEDSKEKLLDLTKRKNSLKKLCFEVIKPPDISYFDDSNYISNSIYNFKKKVGSEEAENISLAISNCNNIIISTKKEKENSRKNRDFFERRYKEESNREVTKYSDRQKESVNKILRYLQMAITNLSSFKNIIRNINEGNLSSYKNGEDLKFMDLAGRIIAYSMDNKLLTVDGVYIKLKSYNLLEQSFNCINNGVGITIHKDDLSTGLTSANYLKQRIENVKGDYVIILLDEIGNMSSDILEELLKSIKKLEEENRLVLALLTHPSTKEIKITSH